MRYLMKRKRQIFYSFHYALDSWRVSQVRNIGVVEGNRPATDNDWETVVARGEHAIEQWIQEQMNYRSCTIVLAGEKTANRKWINYEIKESWKKGMGVVGIYIHGLKGQNGFITNKGKNPFDYFNYNNDKLSKIVKCYNPVGNNSKERYEWIAKNLVNIVEEAIQIRNNN